MITVKEEPYYSNGLPPINVPHVKLGVKYLLLLVEGGELRGRC